MKHVESKTNPLSLVRVLRGCFLHCVASMNQAALVTFLSLQHVFRLMRLYVGLVRFCWKLRPLHSCTFYSCTDSKLAFRVESF